MQTSTLLTCLVASAALAQAPKPEPTLRPSVDALALSAPVHSRADDGTVRTTGANYLARFDGSGATFVPYLGSDAETEWPVTMVLESARIGEFPLPVGAALPSRDGDLVAFDRGAVVEQYATQLRGIEQRFVLVELPTRGELRLRIDFASPLQPSLRGDGVHFTGPRGGVHYGNAVAIDGNGRRTAMTTELHRGALELVVPASFVANATLPLVVDPLLTPLTQFHNDSVPIGNLDAAWDQVAGEWFVVFDYAFHANNLHVFGQRLTADGLPTGAVVAIDDTAVSWYRPRIANLASPHRFLVVAECDDVVDLPWVSGRTVTVANGAVALGTQFVIAKSGQNGAPIGTFARPDVGGDGGLSGNGTFCVVYEYGSAPDRDVHLRTVAANGTLLGGYVLVAATSYDERGPVVSKSNGFAGAVTQRWGVLYERRVTIGAGDAAKVWCSLVNRDGTLRSLLGQTTWILFDAAVTGRGGFDIASPTDDVGGGRTLFAVESRPTATMGLDLFGVAFSDVGVGGVPVNLSALEPYGATFQAKDQRAPVVDSDGTRFAMTWTHDHSATDRDVYATTFAPVNGNYVRHDATVIASSTADEGSGLVVSRRSGGGQPSAYLVALRRIVAGDHRLLASIYQGTAAGGLAVRAAGCGGLGITGSGSAALATPVTMALSNMQGVTGFLLGAPVSLAVPGCVGCTAGTTMDAVVAGASWTFVIPNVVGLVGLSLAVQGFDFAPVGPCLGQIRASNAIDFTVR